jgi:hypothetical protein
VNETYTAPSRRPRSEGVLRADRRVEVDRVGVVARDLARGRHDALEARARRVGLEVGDEAAFEDVHERAVGVRDVGLALEVPLGSRPALVDLGEQVDQLAQRLAALGLAHRGVSFGVIEAMLTALSEPGLRAR